MKTIRPSIWRSILMATLFLVATPGLTQAIDNDLSIEQQVKSCALHNYKETIRNHTKIEKAIGDALRMCKPWNSGLDSASIETIYQQLLSQFDRGPLNKRIDFGSPSYYKERARFRSCLHSSVDAGVETQDAIERCNPTYLIGEDIDDIVARKIKEKEALDNE